MIGNTLNLPVDEREEGTMATSVLGLVKGCSFFRVHDDEEKCACACDDRCNAQGIRWQACVITLSGHLLWNRRRKRTEKKWIKYGLKI